MKRNCKDFKAVRFQKSGKTYFFMFKVFLVATFNAFPFPLLSLWSSLLFIIIIIIIIIRYAPFCYIFLNLFTFFVFILLCTSHYFIVLSLLIYVIMSFKLLVSNFQESRFHSIQGWPYYPNYLETSSRFCLCFFPLTRVNFTHWSNGERSEGKLNFDNKFS